MTYNQITKRIIQIATAHRQIRNCYKGLVTDFLTDKKTLFPSAFLQDNGNGNISVGGKDTAFPFRLFILDLVHLSEDTKVNEQDVMSDCMLIAIDLIAQIASFNYTDWRISADNPTQFVVEDENDFIAGMMVDFTIKVIFNKDKCQIPSSGMPVYVDKQPSYINDIKYIATGTELNILNIPEIVGSKVVLVTREGLVIYQVSNNPNTSEFTWDLNVISLGLQTNQGERYLVLYQPYNYKSSSPFYIDQQTKLENEMTYTATGLEGKILNIPEIVGKKALFIARESLIMYEVKNSPNTTEFVWNGTTVTLGLETNQGERYLISYRNY